MAKKYVYIYDNSEINLNLNMLADFCKLDNIQCLDINKKKGNNIFLRPIRKIHLSGKLAKFIKFPMKWIWYEELAKLHISKNDNYYIIVSTDIFWKCDISVIKKYERYKNVKLILILFDTIGVNTPAGRLIDTLYKDKMWDYIFTYDKQDVEKYNFIYLDEHYYSKPEINEGETIENDAYFIGALKPGRTSETIELFEYLQKNGINAKFDIVKNDGKTLEYEKSGFNILEQRKPYNYVLEQTLKTNCIIEFLQKGQNAQTLRYFEAVCFNKKLLTNNKNVKKLSFYNEKYIKIFDRLEDIDIEWIKRREKIEYNYQNEFSPIHIIEKIEELEQK